MSQALSVQPPVVSGIVAVAGSADSAQVPDSGPSFGETLAGQLATDAAAAEPAADPAATAPDANAVTAADVVAAPGNLLPPALPPVAIVAATPPPANAIGRTVAAESTDGLAPAPSVLSLPEAGTLASQPAVSDSAEGFASTGLPAGDAAATAGRARSSPGTVAAADAQAGRAVPPGVAATREASPVVALSAPPAAETAGARGERTSPETGSPIAASSAAAGTPPVSNPVNAFAPLLASPLTAAESAPAAATPAPAGGQVAVPFGQPAWNQAFSSQVVWAVGQNIPSAELHLSPPELGPVSVRIRMDQDQASISFTSPHAAVREAIEAALPRLRDMLGAQGIVLADANVAQHGHSQQAHQQGNGHAGGAGRDHGVDNQGEPLVALRIPAAGVLDLYA